MCALLSCKSVFRVILGFKNPISYLIKSMARLDVVVFIYMYIHVHVNMPPQ